MLLSACDHYCTSCIAQAPSGEIVEHVVACDKSDSYINGFVAGIKSRYEEEGDTVKVNCTLFIDN